jgi:hypothetical protein
MAGPPLQGEKCHLCVRNGVLPLSQFIQRFALDRRFGRESVTRRLAFGSPPVGTNPSHLQSALGLILAATRIQSPPSLITAALLQEQRQRAGRDQRGCPDHVEVYPGAAQDAHAKLFEHQQRHERGHRQIARSMCDCGENGRAKI